MRPEWPGCSVLAVVGAGSMGALIAQQAALHGVEVRLQDVSQDQLLRAAGSNRSLLERRVEKGRLQRPEMGAALARVSTTIGDERFRPSSALEAKVRAGELGRKTGRGWYVYSREQGD
jgi:3-hydroxyacyl-CoA dehydrogenase